MKNIFLLIFITTISQVLFSQTFSHPDAEKYAPGAEIVRFKENSKVPTYIKFNNNYTLREDKVIDYTKRFIQSDNSDFILKSSQKNRNNSQTYRYIQTLDGYPIEFSLWNVQVRDGKVTALNGDISANPNASTEFVISEEAALEAALEYIGAERYMWQDEKNEQLLKKMKKDESATYYPVGERVIAPNNINFSESKLRPAYKFEIYSSMPHDKKAVYVDAITGKILFDLPLIHFTSVVGTAQTVYSGTQQITTEYNGTEYTLEDNTRGNGIITLNANNQPDYFSASDFTDDDNVWNNVNASLDQYATDAHFATAKTYDYYDSIHNRNSIDDNGFQLISYIHFDLIGTGNYGSNINAFWNGIWMTYGDGSGSVTPLTTVDICGHEITHGLTEHTAGLIYQYESGALNEAFSDIFGTAIEFYAVPNNADWTIGEDIGYVMRSLSDPKAHNNPNTYKGTYWNFGINDNGGVHTNSGPMNYWFYLLSEGGSGTNDLGNNYNVTAIGIDKAEQIAFNLLTQYLTPTSGYSDAWFYGLQAATDIYGACSPEVKAVGDAFYAIGVIEDPYINAAYANFTTFSTQSCSAPFTVDFVNTSYNCDSCLWEFGDGSTSTAINPTHTYTQYGNYDVKLTVSSNTCGSSFELKEDYITIDDALPCVTVMLVDGTETIVRCSGIIYDTGGEDAICFTENTSVLTIHSPGASAIVLNILEFDIEEGDDGSCNYDHLAFFDGNSTASPLINNTLYCNTTGSPGTISSTGEYLTIRLFSDPLVTGDGFKIEYYCIHDSSAPTPIFSVDETFSCDGQVNFIDQSVNNPASWLWDFGDGSTSTSQNPTHLYTANGTYTVRLTVTNSFGDNSLLKIAYITVEMPEAPHADTSITVCHNQNFEINLPIGDSVCWYNNMSDTIPVYKGNYWAHDPITQNTTYYLRDIFDAEEHHVGHVNNTSGGSYFGHVEYIHYLVFDAYDRFILKSVSVNAQGSGNRIIAIRNRLEETLLQKTVYIPSGVSRVELNMEIPQGTDLQIACLDAPDLYRSGNTAILNYPYLVDDIVSIKHSSATGNEYEYYYYFYDWEISTIPCESNFTSISLVPEICNSVSENGVLNNVFIAPNPNNGQFEIIGLEDMSENNVEITDVSGKIVFSSNNFIGSTINLTTYSDGFYFLKLSNEKGQKVIKFVIWK